MAERYWNHPAKFSSNVWKYFGISTKDDKKAVCKTCNQEITYTGGTTNLSNHMKRHHGINPLSKGTVKVPALGESKASKPIKNTNPSTSGTSSSSTSNPFLMAQKMKLPQDKINRITSGIARYLIDDMRPFSTVDSRTSRNMILECEPRYRFPCRGTFSDTIVPWMFDCVTAHVKTELHDAGTIAWTTDSWTSRATQSYVTVTAHFISSDMNLCSRVLQTRELSESHTGEHVGNVLLQAQLEWDCKVCALTTDNAANMRIAAETAGIPIHIGCFAHTLNLASGRALDVKEVHNILAKMRLIVSFMHRSTTAAALLRKKQVMLQLPENKLLIDVRTRWNSSYLMVQRFLEQQVAILATLTDETMKKKQHQAKSIQAESILGPADVGHCEEFLILMEPLYQATLALSADQYPTNGLIVPLLQKFKRLYSPHEDDNPFQQKVKKSCLPGLGEKVPKAGIGNVSGRGYCS